jgi:hypothetical protein
MSVILDRFCQFSGRAFYVVNVYNIHVKSRHERLCIRLGDTLDVRIHAMTTLVTLTSAAGFEVDVADVADTGASIAGETCRQRSVDAFSVDA